MREKRSMDRRKFVGGLAGASLVWPNVLQAQQGRKLARVGLLTVGSTTAEMTGPEPQSSVIRSFLGGMRALGYVYGRDFVTEPRGGAGMPERYAELIAELVALPVDVIVASGPMLGLLKKANSTIPIVMSHGEDPLAKASLRLSRAQGEILLASAVSWPSSTANGSSCFASSFPATDR
jgi:putative ABC transport system substrate-binding protein